MTAIMHQHADAGHIIGVEAFDVEIVDVDRCFQQLVLDFFNDDILTVDENKYISGAKVNRFCPALNGRIEGMARGANNLLSTHENMDKLACLIYIGLKNRLQCCLACLFLPC